MATAYAYLVLMPATYCWRPCREFDEFELHRQIGQLLQCGVQYVSVGYDTVKHAKYRY